MKDLILEQMYRLSATAAVLLTIAGGCKREAPTPPPPEKAATIPEDTTAVQELPTVPLKQLPEATQAEIQGAMDRYAQAPDDAERAGIAAALMLVNGFPNQAAAWFGRAAQLQPDIMRWQYYLGRAFSDSHEFERAIRAFERGIELNDRYAPLYVQLANLLIERDVARARSLYQKAAELDPNYAEAHYGLGRVAKLNGETEAARAHFERALEIWPQFDRAHYELAMLLRSVGKKEEAAEHVKQFENGSPPPPASDKLLQILQSMKNSSLQMRKRAADLIKRGRIEDAIEIYKAAIEREPNRPASYYLLGRTYGETGRFDKAVEQFEKALKVDPDFIAAKTKLAQALAAMGRFDKAEIILADALAQNPEHAPSMRILALLHQRRGELQKAADLLARATQLQPALPLAHFDYGRLLYQMGKYDEALTHLEEGLSQFHDYPEAHFLVGSILDKRNKGDEARAAWLEAIKINPRFLNAYVAVSTQAIHNGEFEAARSILEKGLQHLPDAAVLANNLAWLIVTSASINEKDRADAVRWAEKACELTGRAEPAFLSTLAAAYMEVGRSEDAIKAMTAAIAAAEKLGQTAQVEEYQDRLETLTAGKPFHAKRPSP